MLPEVRMARIIDAIGLHQARKLSCVEAAELLGMSERHFRRLRDAYEAHGAEGVVDRRRGRASGRRAGVDEIAWVAEEFRTRYFDFTAKHFHTPKAGEPVDKTCLTQVGRALAHLGIEHIPSYCPEGRGRMERLFGPLQSRLPPLLRLDGIASIEAANHWLSAVYVPQHNARFGVAPAEEGTAFVPF